MGFIPEVCLIKSLCSLGIMRADGEEVIVIVEMDPKSKKAMHFINLIEQHKELTLTA